MHTNKQGLSTIEAEEKLKQTSPNELEESEKKSIAKMLLSQFRDVMILILLAAAILSGFIGDFTDTIVIIVIVLLNAILGFYLEYLSQIGHVLAIRSESSSLFSIGIFSNKPLFGAVLLTFLLQVLITYVPFLQSIFKTQSLSLNEFIIMGIASSLVFSAVEIEKGISKR